MLRSFVYVGTPCAPVVMVQWPNARRKAETYEHASQQPASFPFLEGSLSIMFHLHSSFGKVQGKKCNIVCF